MERFTRLEDWFCRHLEGVEASPDARAYLVSLFSSMRSTRDDMSRESIVLAFAEARTTGEFQKFQRIGDWVVWGMSFAPESFETKEVVIDLGRLSYYACWRMTNKEWRVYEELADDLPRLTKDMRRRLGRPF
jgi:hypothetical protein